jgi:hypothetical protein
MMMEKLLFEEASYANDDRKENAQDAAVKVEEPAAAPDS